MSTPRRDSDADAAAGGPSVELAKAYDLLADGRWHDYETLVRQLVGLVPPGKAIRTAENARVQRARQNARARGTELPAAYRPLRVAPLSTEELIAIGSRAIVRKALNGSRLEVDPPGRPVRGQRRRIRDPRPGG